MMVAACCVFHFVVVVVLRCLRAPNKSNEAPRMLVLSTILYVIRDRRGNGEYSKKSKKIFMRTTHSKQQRAIEKKHHHHHNKTTGFLNHFRILYMHC